MPEPPRARRYDSPLRQENAAATRLRVIRAAAALFSERGWTGTSIRQVAKAAGVAVETVYASAGGKLDLLAAAVDVGVVGDAGDLPLRERPEFRRLALGDRRARLDAVGSMVAQIYARAGGLVRALQEAAFSDAGAARLQARLLARQRTDVEQGMRLVLERDPTPAEVDETWVILGFGTYDHLVRVAGWTPDRYARWVGDVLARRYPEDR
jgi:AcrR family transcriptional regulator